MEELTLEYHVKVSTPEGLEYQPRSYAAQTVDGSWARGSSSILSIPARRF